MTVEYWPIVHRVHFLAVFLEDAVLATLFGLLVVAGVIWIGSAIWGGRR